MSTDLFEGFTFDDSHKKRNVGMLDMSEVCLSICISKLILLFIFKSLVLISISFFLRVSLRPMNAAQQLSLAFGSKHSLFLNG